MTTSRIRHAEPYLEICRRQTDWMKVLEGGRSLRMTDSIEDTGGKRKDCIVKCERCKKIFPGWIDGDGNSYPLGPSNNQCCEGYDLREVEVEVPDKFAND